jgi:hypothetical protein
MLREWVRCPRCQQRCHVVELSMSAWSECQSCAWRRQRYNAPQPSSPPPTTPAEHLASPDGDSDRANSSPDAPLYKTWPINLTRGPTGREPDNLCQDSQPIYHRSLSRVREWLLDELRRSSWDVGAADTTKRARAAGITARQLRRARERLRVISYKPAWNEGWRWTLPN